MKRRPSCPRAAFVARLSNTGMTPRWVFPAIHSNRAARWRVTTYGVRRGIAALRVRDSGSSRRFLPNLGSRSRPNRGVDPILSVMPACARSHQLTRGAFCLIRDKFRPYCFLVLPVSFAQVLFQDFSRSGLWQAFIKVDRVWAFVMGQARTAEFNQLALVCMRPQFQDHERLWHFAPLFVRYRNHRRLQNPRMGHERLFHLERRYVFTAADDDVFLAVHDQQVAVFINGGHVAGMEPLATQRFGGRFGLLPVPFHDPIAPRDDFSYCLAIAWDIHASIVDNTHFDAGVGKPGHGLAHELLFALQFESVLDEGMRQRG